MSTIFAFVRSLETKLIHFLHFLSAMFAGSFVKLAGNKAGYHSFGSPLAFGSFPSRCYVVVDVVVVNDYNNGARRTRRNIIENNESLSSFLIAQLSCATGTRDNKPRKSFVGYYKTESSSWKWSIRWSVYRWEKKSLSFGESTGIFARPELSKYR